MQFAVMTKKWRSVEFLNHNAPLHLAQLVQPMLAEQHIQQVRQPQNSPHPAACQFLLFPALSTLWEVKRLKMRNDQKYRHTATYTDVPSGLLEVRLAAEVPWNKLIQTEVFCLKL